MKSEYLVFNPKSMSNPFPIISKFLMVYMSLGDKDKYFNLIFQTKMDQLFLSEKSGGCFFLF